MKKTTPKKAVTRKYERTVTVTDETTGVKPVVSNWKRYLVSSLVTFITAFMAALIVNLEALSWTSDWQNMKVLVFSAGWGAILTAARGAVKVLTEWLVKNNA